MRSRLRVPLAMLAAAATVLTVTMAACRFTGDLTGGDAPDGSASCNLAACPVGPQSAPTCGPNGQCGLLCQAGFGDCDDASANGCEANLLTATPPQAKNCGRCGHDCFGGRCSSGLCQPVPLAQADDAPDRIVVDDDPDAGFIYGINSTTGAITRTPKTLTPGNGMIVIHREARILPPMAIDDAGVYYLGGPAATPDAGVTASVQMIHFDRTAQPGLVPDRPSPSNLTLGSNGVLYWVEQSSGLQINRCRLLQARPGHTDCVLPPQPIAITGTNPITATTADAQNVYWADKLGIYSNSGGRPSPVTSASNPSGLEVNGSFVYYFASEDAGSGIRSCDHAGCDTPTAVVSAQDSPIALAVEGGGNGNVYWTTGDGAIKSIPKSGESPPPINPPTVVERILYQRHLNFQPWDIAIDRSTIYFTDRYPGQGEFGHYGTLYKLAKP